MHILLRVSSRLYELSVDVVSKRVDVSTALNRQRVSIERVNGWSGHPWGLKPASAVYRPNSAPSQGIDELLHKLTELKRYYLYLALNFALGALSASLGPFGSGFDAPKACMHPLIGFDLKVQKFLKSLRLHVCSLPP